MAAKTSAGTKKKSQGDLLVLPLCSQGAGSVALHRPELEDWVRAAEASEVFRGKAQEVFLLAPLGGKPQELICLVGLGNRDEVTEESVRRSMAVAASKASKATSVTIDLSGVPGDARRLAEAAVVGFRLGAYRFDRFKKDRTKRPLARLTVLPPPGSPKDTREGAAVGEIVAQATAFARDVANTPGNHMTPTILAKEARAMAKGAGLRCEVLDERRMAQLGMGSLLAVSQGSDEPARMIVLEHGRPGRGPTICLVGKGLTFDAGGISLKPAADMDKMRYDMCGGAAVLGAMKAVADLKLPLHVVGVVPSSENMPDGRATRPGDIVRAMNGTTIEVLNTDAEGRLILADALCYAQKFKPSLIIDLATLTGAVVVALGKTMAAMLGTDEAAMEELQRRGQETFERVWRLPLDDDYDQLMKGKSADLHNIGGRNAGTITAAQFLQHFVAERPWIHLDIAGVAYDDPSRPYNKGVGATGFGVRLLTRFLQGRARGGKSKAVPRKAKKS